MPTRANHLNRTFNRLTAIGYAGASRQGALWLWRCSCGKLTVALGKRVVRGNIKSCGCWQREASAKFQWRHGMRDTPEYKIWASMVQRCTNASDKAFRHYGGRGITVCDRWTTSANFFADMGPRPSSKHSVERIDNNKGYSPDNCKWATSAEQSRNTRRTRMLTFNGETMCLKDWADRLGCHYLRLHYRLGKQGWTIERTLTTPMRRLNK